MSRKRKTTKPTKPTITIVISGPQGSGKSTIGAAIAEMLANSAIAVQCDGLPGYGFDGVRDGLYEMFHAYPVNTPNVTCTR